MHVRFRRLLSVMLALLSFGGCTTPIKQAESPLKPAQMTPGSCVLEVFFIRVPFGDSQVNDDLWQDIDEQQISAELRERLMRNGFRAGIVCGQMPVGLAKLLELSDKPPPSENTKNANLADLEVRPTVIRRHMQVKAGQSSEVMASGTYDELPVMVWEPDQISGETFNQAQGVFTVKAFPSPDGSVRVEMVPEMQHDQTRQKWIPDQGMMRLESSKPKHIFENMSISATLSPGGMIVMTSLPKRPGSLGHHFFTENDGRLQQKLLIIRLSQTQHDDLFIPSEVLPLK